MASAREDHPSIHLKSEHPITKLMWHLMNSSHQVDPVLAPQFIAATTRIAMNLYESLAQNLAFPV